jgi:hypothetical protein
LACLAAAAGKKSVAKEPKSRSGPRAPAGKKPLMVIIDEDLIKAAKIAASRTDGMFQGSSKDLLEAWLAGRKTRK